MDNPSRAGAGSGRFRRGHLAHTLLPTIKGSSVYHHISPRRNGQKGPQGPQISRFRIWSARYSAARIESARMVRVGFCEPDETNELPSTTNRFLISWLWLNLLRTDSFGLLPMRQVPSS